MGKYKYLTVHCTDTYPNQQVIRATLEMWHKSPRDLPDGKVRYKGKTYENRAALHDEKIAGQPIEILKGRGWDRLGYSDLIKRDGSVINLTPYNGDDIIQTHEITWGAAGVNGISRHIVLEGGRTINGYSGMNKFLNIFTQQQYEALKMYVLKELEKHHHLQVVGHYHFNKAKTCPNFSVESFMKHILSL